MKQHYSTDAYKTNQKSIVDIEAEGITPRQTKEFLYV